MEHTPFPPLQNYLKKAVLIDRDGVVNRTVDRGDQFTIRGTPVRWTAPFRREEIEIYSGVREALALIAEKGYLRIMVTNQPDVANGFIVQDEFDLMMDVFRDLPFTDIFICMHRADAGCPCRKPKPGMLLDAHAKHGFRIQNSFMIGDQESDIDAGKTAGVRTIRIVDDTVIETGAEFRARSLYEAACLLP